MHRSDVFCMDCLEAMRKMKDNEFDLAVVDPPYGDGLYADDGGGKGWFTKHNQACSQNVNVEREREREPTEVQPIWRQIRPLQVRIGGGRHYTFGLPELREQAAHGRRNTQKNHNVGRCAGTGIF